MRKPSSSKGGTKSKPPAESRPIGRGAMPVLPPDMGMPLAPPPGSALGPGGSMGGAPGAMPPVAGMVGPAMKRGGKVKNRLPKKKG